MPSIDDALAPELTALQEKHRLRARCMTQTEMDGAVMVRGGKRYINFSSNDYFGLSQHPAVLAASGASGAGASALVTGYHPALAALEAALAKAKNTQAALVFSSGYTANMGAISALAGKGDLIIADKLAHACMIDGAQLSGAVLRRYAHNDMAHLARILKNRADYRRCLIVTETIFSMDGDRAPLEELAAIAAAHDAWLVTDDAHGLGMINVNPASIQIGTLSKGLGALGGYVCGSQLLIDYLINHARSYIFTTALAPSICSAATKALELLQADASLRAKPLEYAREFTHCLGLPQAQSPIVPIIMGSDAQALAAAQKLADEGFWVSAIRPPTVPEGTARLRFAFSALHEAADIKRLTEVIKTHGFLKHSHH